MKKLMVTALAAMAATQIFAIQGTINTAGDSKTGDIKWQPRAKQYVVSTKMGKTMVDVEVKLADVTSLDIAKPASFDKAVQMVQSGQGAGAIAILSKIVADYKMLQWDKPAGRYLAMAHIAAGNAQKAFDACKPIIDEDKSAAYTGDLAPAYWQTLLSLGKLDELNKCLKKAISSGNRPASAAAFSMRGDLIVAQSNDKPDELKRALSEGYLRTVLMYQDAPCATERREAMLKAAACFDKLGQSSRAENLRSQAKAM